MPEKSDPNAQSIVPVLTTDISSVAGECFDLITAGQMVLLHTGEKAKCDYLQERLCGEQPLPFFLSAFFLPQSENCKPDDPASVAPAHAATGGIVTDACFLQRCRLPLIFGQREGHSEVRGFLRTFSRENDIPLLWELAQFFDPGIRPDWPREELNARSNRALFPDAALQLTSQVAQTESQTPFSLRFCDQISNAELTPRVRQSLLTLAAALEDETLLPGQGERRLVARLSAFLEQLTAPVEDIYKADRTRTQALLFWENRRTELTSTHLKTLKALGTPPAFSAAKRDATTPLPTIECRIAVSLLAEDCFFPTNLPLSPGTNREQEAYGAVVGVRFPARFAVALEQTRIHALPLLTVCSALADPIRLAVLQKLSHSDCFATALAEDLRLPFPKLAYHLEQLVKAGLISAQKEGRRVRYHLTRPAMDALAARLVCTFGTNASTFETFDPMEEI